MKINNLEDLALKLEWLEEEVIARMNERLVRLEREARDRVDRIRCMERWRGI